MLNKKNIAAGKIKKLSELESNIFKSIIRLIPYFPWDRPLDYYIWTEPITENSEEISKYFYENLESPSVTEEII